LYRNSKVLSNPALDLFILAFDMRQSGLTIRGRSKPSMVLSLLNPLLGTLRLTWLRRANICLLNLPNVKSKSDSYRRNRTHHFWSDAILQFDTDHTIPLTRIWDNHLD
jgi:hypothetical protein